MIEQETRSRKQSEFSVGSRVLAVITPLLFAVRATAFAKAENPGEVNNNLPTIVRESNNKSDEFPLIFIGGTAISLGTAAACISASELLGSKKAKSTLREIDL